MSPGCVEAGRYDGQPESLRRTTVNKCILGGLVLVLVTCGWSTISVGEQPPAPQGELRIVDKHSMNWISITLNVFEHLMELDKDGTLVPRLATSWQWRDDQTLDVTPRQGVTCHNGGVLDAEIVKLNWEENSRQRQPRILGDFINCPAGTTREI